MPHRALRYPRKDKPRNRQNRRRNISKPTAGTLRAPYARAQLDHPAKDPSAQRAAPRTIAAPHPPILES
jgi:hypothetical protein